MLGNLQKPLPGDVALVIRDSFFCPSKPGSSDGIKVCCPIDGIEPPTTAKSTFEDRGTCFNRYLC